MDADTYAELLVVVLEDPVIETVETKIHAEVIHVANFGPVSMLQGSSGHWTVTVYPSNGAYLMRHAKRSAGGPDPIMMQYGGPFSSLAKAWLYALEACGATPETLKYVGRLFPGDKDEAIKERRDYV